MTSGPVLAKAGDLAAILTNLETRDVLFIDEIHRLNPAVEEVLYPAMEDYELDLVIGEGPAARTVRIELQPFTLVGATTRLGLPEKRLLQRLDPGNDGIALVADPEAEIDGDLIVPAARGVKPAGGLSDQVLQPRLDIHMNVFEGGGKCEFSALDL